MTTANTADSVYNIHKAKILGSIVGKYIKQLHDVAETVIPNEDAASLRCSTFEDFTYMCNYIGVKEEIRADRVYPALRLLGYNKCYHDYKLSGSDIFSDIHTLVDKCKLSRDNNTMRFANKSSELFSGVKTKSYRVDAQVSAVAVLRALQCGIRTSNLNLYHALCGLQVLVDNEPDYILLSEEELVTDALKMLIRADKNLLVQKRFLEVLCE